MGIVNTFFETLRARGKTFKDMKDLLRQFLEFLDLSHPELTRQTNRYDFIHILKEHVRNPMTHRLRDWRKYGLYDEVMFVTDMDVSSGDSSESDDLMRMFAQVQAD
jgi:hypothetical protein